MILVSIYKYKEVNSYVLCAVLALIFHQLLVSIDYVLWSIVIDVADSGRKSLARYIWYGTWVALDLVFISVIYLSHKLLNISTTKHSEFLSLSYLAMLTLQIVGNIDAFYIQSELINAIYQYGIPSINIGIISYIAWNLRGTPRSDSRTFKYFHD